MKQILKGITALLLAAGLAACGSSGSSGSHASSPASYSGSTNSLAAADYAKEEMADYELGVAMAPSPSEEARGTSEEQPGVTGVKLVYTGSVTIETLGYEDTVKNVRERIKQYQGIIEQENEWDGDHSWYYTDGRGRTTNRNISLTVRIPTKDFDNFMNDMDGAGKVTSRSQNVENISRKYSDNSIEIESLELQQTRLLEMMEKAETVEEMIMIEERLSDVQTKLNQKKSYRSSLDTDVEYSTIYLNINEVQEYTPVQSPGIEIGGFGKRITETLKNSGKFFVYVVQELILFLIRIAPFVIAIALIIFAIRAWRKSRGLDPNPFRGKKGAKPVLEKADKTDVGEVKK